MQDRLYTGARAAGRAALQRVGVLGSRLRDRADAARSVTVGRPAQEVEAFFREPEGLSRALANFATVTPAGDGRWHWAMRSREGGTLEWDMELAEDRPGELLRWRATGGDVDAESWVRLRPAPHDLGTEVRLYLRLDASEGAPALPAGVVVLRALHRAKALMEAGEAPTLERNPAARRATAPGHADESGS
jgi:uncharacterized membrane protein